MGHGDGKSRAHTGMGEAFHTTKIGRKRDGRMLKRLFWDPKAVKGHGEMRRMGMGSPNFTVEFPAHIPIPFHPILSPVNTLANFGALCQGAEAFCHKVQILQNIWKDGSSITRSSRKN